MYRSVANCRGLAVCRNMVKADANGNPILTAEGCLEPVIEYPYAQVAPSTLYFLGNIVGVGGRVRCVRACVRVLVRVCACSP